MAAHPRSAAAPPHSLAESPPGTFVEVVHVLFGSLRQRYESAGIRAGARLRLRGRTGDRLVVELTGGATAEVDAGHAPFVEVRPLAATPAPDLALPGHGPWPYPDPR